MRNRQGDDDKAARDKVIQAAEQAIKDSDHRSQLLDELLEGLDVSAGLKELIFRPEPSALIQQAEAELIAEVNRSRSKQFPQQERAEKARPRRPTLMRGIII